VRQALHGATIHRLSLTDLLSLLTYLAALTHQTSAPAAQDDGGGRLQMPHQLEARGGPFERLPQDIVVMSQDDVTVSLNSQRSQGVALRAGTGHDHDRLPGASVEVARSDSPARAEVVILYRLLGHAARHGAADTEASPRRCALSDPPLTSFARGHELVRGGRAEGTSASGGAQVPYQTRSVHAQCRSAKASRPPTSMLNMGGGEADEM
jgi:hypothetical protein